MRCSPTKPEVWDCWSAHRDLLAAAVRRSFDFKNHFPSRHALDQFYFSALLHAGSNISKLYRHAVPRTFEQGNCDFNKQFFGGTKFYKIRQNIENDGVNYTIIFEVMCSDRSTNEVLHITRWNVLPFVDLSLHMTSADSTDTNWNHTIRVSTVIMYTKYHPNGVWR